MDDYKDLSRYAIAETKELLNSILFYSKKYGIDEYYIRMSLVFHGSSIVTNEVMKYAIKQKGVIERLKKKEEKRNSPQYKKKKEEKKRKKLESKGIAYVPNRKFIPKNIFDERVKFYKRYIKSDAWKLKRLDAIKHHGQDCQQCGHFLPISMIQVHHITYKRLGKELMEDLMIVCKPCHEKIHGINQESELDINQ